MNVPPLLGKHILSYGLGRRRNMTQVGSDNWSGYADINGTYSSVSSTWTEPSVSCTQSSGSGGFLGLFGTAGGYNTTYSSFWVGLDGYASSSVEQTGTAADCTGSGPTYYAWWEMFPAGENQLSSTQYPVSAGDTMTGTVTSTSASSYTLSLTDAQHHWTFSMPVSGSSYARSSAEWVAEAPSSCSLLFCSALPLSNFGQVTFSNARATSTEGTTGPISGFTDAAITMSDNGTTLATPGPLVPNSNNTADAFSVEFDNS